MTLTVVRSTGWVFDRMSKIGLLSHFPHEETRSWIWGKNITEVMCLSYYNNLDHLAKMVLANFLCWKIIIILLLHILYSLSWQGRGGATKVYILERKSISIIWNSSVRKICLLSPTNLFVKWFIFTIDSCLLEIYFGL